MQSIQWVIVKQIVNEQLVSQESRSWVHLMTALTWSPVPQLWVFQPSFSHIWALVLTCKHRNLNSDISLYIRSIPVFDRLLLFNANLVLQIWPINIVCSRVVERNWNQFTTKLNESLLNIFLQSKYPVNLNSSLMERPNSTSLLLLHIGEIL